MPQNDLLFHELNRWAAQQSDLVIDLPELERRGRLFALAYDLDLNDKDFSDTIAAVLENIEVRLGTGAEVVDVDFEPWFTRWREENKTPRWDRYAQYLIETKGWSSDVVKGLDAETSQLVDLAGNPNAEGEWNRRGLAIGEVQSGKTASYIGILNKALDAGYKLIIVIGGHTNDLRRQTQERVDSDLLGYDTNYSAVEIALTENSRNAATIGVGKIDGALTTPNRLTSVWSDFSKSSKMVNGVTVGEQPVVAVVKKHAGTLKNLAAFLRAQPGSPLTQPMIVIDDEADWASVNTGTEEKIVAVNRAIRELLDVTTRSSYLAITATPFANILINSEIEKDLFPKDYIRALPSPSNYLGVEDYHTPEARNEHPHRLQTDVDDVLELLPYEHKRFNVLDSLPESLEKAIYAFFIGTAARYLRDGRPKPASMMVNISRFNDVQETIFQVVNASVEATARTLRAELRAGFESESACVTKMQQTLTEVYPELQFTWDDLREPLMAVSEQIHTTLVNGNTTKEMEKYVNGLSREERTAFQLRPVVQVGGIVLARGLTLEGLQVSYFIRRAGAADTLLQMGRWFGYRPGYGDLVRVWIDEPIVDLFAYTAEISAELRDSLNNLKRLGLTPKDFGLRIRMHPETFRITAANKQKHGEVVSGDVSIHGYAFSTPVLDASKERRAANRRAADHLASRLLKENASEQESNGDNVWRGVPSELVSEFFTSFAAGAADPFMGSTSSDSKSQIWGALDEAHNGQTWDVKFISGTGGEVKLGLDDVITVKQSIRNAMRLVDSKSIVLGNRRLASSEDLLKALPGTTQSKVRERFADLSQRVGYQGPKGLTDNFVASEGLERPVLLVYALGTQADKMQKSLCRELTPEEREIFAETMIAALVAFPSLPDSDKYAVKSGKAHRFIANTVYQRWLLGTDEQEDDIDDEE